LLPAPAGAKAPIPSGAGFILATVATEGRGLQDADASTTSDTAHLQALVYELLDAHVDTLTLAAELSENQGWAAHLDYLRDLQRVARETLARFGG